MSSPGSVVLDPPPNPEKLASPEQLPALDQAAKESGSQSEVGKASNTCPKTSWFAIRILHKPAGAEADIPVDGLTLSLDFSCSGPAKTITSKSTETNRTDALSPGGTCKVLATDHSDVVWEVETDIP
ncbi:MAG TPA: hypothetical protein VGN16_03020 [Acidobacteriaceae bacterium]